MPCVPNQDVWLGVPHLGHKKLSGSKIENIQQFHLNFFTNITVYAQSAIPQSYTGTAIKQNMQIIYLHVCNIAMHYVNTLLFTQHVFPMTSAQILYMPDICIAII